MTEQRTAGPRNFADAIKSASAKDVEVNRMTDEEAELAEQSAESIDLTGGDDSPLGRKAADPPDENAVPTWAKIPPDLVFPKGKQVGFVLFRAEWTDRPDLGDRMILTWGLTDAEEKLAIKATRGESGRTLSESAKRTIRAIDGVRADWTGKVGPGNVDRFWNEVGPKCRPLIINAYWKTHSLTQEETADFFVNCFTFRSAVAQ
jgi:hypothetical protein